MFAKFLFLGHPKSYQWGDQEIVTSIFRESTPSIEIIGHSISNNTQGNYKYHGGTYKELYSYGFEDYVFWRNKFANLNCDLGPMGENVTTEGLNEDSIFIGDRYKMGTAIVEVTQPRMPCLKLNVRLNSKDGIKLFLESKKYGVYYKIIENGVIRVGDQISYLGREDGVPKIHLSELVSVLKKQKISDDLFMRITNFPGLDPVIQNLANDAMKIREET